MTLPPSYYLLKGLLLSRRDIVQNPPFDFTKLRILFHCPVPEDENVDYEQTDSEVWAEDMEANDDDY